MAKDYQEVGTVTGNDVIVLHVGQIWKLRIEMTRLIWRLQSRSHRPIILLIVGSENPGVWKTDLLTDLFVERPGGTSQAEGDVVGRLSQLPVMAGGEGDSTPAVPGSDDPPGSLQLLQ